MHYVKLGRTGLKVSRLCLGAMNFGWSADEPTSFAIMDAALDAGINFIDTADVYSRWIEGNKGGESETIVGKWLKTRSRREVIIATKVRGRMWDGVTGEGLSRAHILQAVEDSLRRLQTDYIDLYQMHFYDVDTPLDETLDTLDTLVKSGKVRYIGVSNYPAWLLMKTLWISDVRKVARFDCIQPHYSLLHRNEFERDLEPMCVDQGIGVIPYSPLAAGFLTGKYTRDYKSTDTARSESSIMKRLIDNEDAYTLLDELSHVAEAHRVPMAQAAIAWLWSRPAVTSPIIGARTVAQLKELIGAVDVKLTDEEVGKLNALTEKF